MARTRLSHRTCSKATHSRSLRYSDCELHRVSNLRASNSGGLCPTPSRRTTTAPACNDCKTRDGVAGTRLLFRTCSEATHSMSLRYQTASCVESPTCEHPVPADSAHAITYDCMEATLYSFVYVSILLRNFDGVGGKHPNQRVQRSPLRRHNKSSERAKRWSRCKTRAASKVRSKVPRHHLNERPRTLTAEQSSEFNIHYNVYFSIRTYCIHNIEFSCPAASPQHYMELPGCIHRCGQHLRGQLQRFVMKPDGARARDGEGEECTAAPI